jgi:DNA primase
MYVSLEQALAKGYGTWRSFTCPVHEDANPSARVNVISGRWVCMSCHATGSTDGYVPDPIRMLDDAMEMLDAVSLEKPESWLDQFTLGKDHPYWLSRFSPDVVHLFRLGYDGTTGMPCYPIRAMNGHPLGIVLRNLDDPEGPKYKYPKGVRKTELLFGVKEAQQTEVLFLVEGAMDVCAVREAGHDAVGSYGSLLDAKQVAVIRGLAPRKVFIAYDMDKAGHAGAGQAERDLGRAGVLCERVFWNDRWSDLADMDLETRSSTLSKVLASKD